MTTPDDRRNDIAFRGRACDARGREVRVINPVRMRLLRRHDVIEREALEAIVEDIVPGFRRNLWFAIVAIGLAVVITVGGILADVLREGPGAWQDLVSTLRLMFPTFIAVGVGGVAAPWLAVRRERQKRTIAALYRHRRCLHCGYDLRNLPSDGPDGITTCPECACAWRFDRHTAGHGMNDQEPAYRPRLARVAALLVLVGLLVLGGFGGLLLVLR